MVTMVCEPGKGWTGVEELKEQQDGQCSADYVAPVEDSTTNSTQTDEKDKKTDLLDLKDKNGSGRSDLLFHLLVAILFYVIM